MINDTYVRTRVTEVQHEFAAARRWRRRLRRLVDRARRRNPG
ncbi:hypothetical protein [Amycolatopsis balhimycina]|nr:hypothetical protein [Amycolatopsis balhimycina]